MNDPELAAALSAYALQSGLLLAVGLLAPRLLRLRDPRTLLCYWRTLLPIVILLPLGTAVWHPAPSLPILELQGRAVTEVVATALPPPVPRLGRFEVLAVLAVISALALARLGAGLAFLEWCRRRATPLCPFPEALRHLQRRFMLEVPFMVSNRLATPLTFGWARPVVMVPPTFHGLSADQQEGVACHELLHVRRRDWPFTVLEEVIRALLWFHPAVWLLLPRSALCREQIIDARVVRITGKRRPYLDALWHTVCASPMGAVAGAVPFIGRSHLLARIEHLRQEIIMSKTRSIVSGVVLFAVVAATGFVGGTVFASGGGPASEVLGAGGPAASPALGGRSDNERSSGEEEKLQTWDFEGECREITHPVVAEKVAPVYPEDARAERVMGVVVVRAAVTREGVVDSAEVLRSPDERLSASAVDAILQWRYEPALCDGVPVAVYYVSTFKFQLE